MVTPITNINFLAICILFIGILVNKVDEHLYNTNLVIRTKIETSDHGIKCY